MQCETFNYSFYFAENENISAIPAVISVQIVQLAAGTNLPGPLSDNRTFNVVVITFKLPFSRTNFHQVFCVRTYHLCVQVHEFLTTFFCLFHTNKQINNSKWILHSLNIFRLFHFSLNPHVWPPQDL